MEAVCKQREYIRAGTLDHGGRHYNDSSSGVNHDNDTRRWHGDDASLAPEALADCWLLRIHLRPTTGMVDSLRSFASSWYLHKE
jgi:hypothetical protein